MKVYSLVLLLFLVEGQKKQLLRTKRRVSTEIDSHVCSLYIMRNSFVISSQDNNGQELRRKDFWTGNQQLGEYCLEFTGPRCAKGLSCAFFKCYHQPRQLGEPCDGSNPCASGISCDFEGCAHVPRREGEFCNKGACGPGLICTHIPFNKNKKCSSF